MNRAESHSRGSELATLFAILSLVYLGSGTSLSAQIGSGLNATETTTAIGGSTATDTLYADTTNQRWLMTNHNSGPYPVAAWPCTSEGCLVIGGTAQVGSYWTEQQLMFTNMPGVPLLQGNAIPQWGGTNASTAISLDLQNWALVTEVGNTTPATVVNLLAKIGTSGATKAGTGDTAIPTYIVAAGAGTSGNAQLVLAGQVNCTMENTVASSEGLYAIASIMTAGDCKAVALSSIPFGTWIVGQVISASTVAASNALILVRPGYRELSTITGLSNALGSPTTLATSTGTLTNGNLAKIANTSGDYGDSTIAASSVVTAAGNLTNNAPALGNGMKGLSSSSVIGNTTVFATVSGSPSSSTNLASWDGSGNLKDSGVAGTPPFLRLTTYTNSGTTLTTVVTSENIPASTNASFSCSFTWSGQTTNTTALTIGLTTPTSPTAFDANVIIESSNTAPKPLTLTASGSVTGTAVVSGGQNYSLSIYGTLQNGSNAGTLVLQAAESGGGTVTINRGGFCKTFY